MDNTEINKLVADLARPHPSGGVVIERAAIMAAGGDFPAIIEWITAHDGTPESVAPSRKSSGLHGGRISGGGQAPVSGKPVRYVLPAGALH